LQELHKLQRRTPQTTEKNSTNYREELHKLQRRTPQTTEKNSTYYREELHILQRRTPQTPEERRTPQTPEENIWRAVLHAAIIEAHSVVVCFLSEQATQRHAIFQHKSE
jgi:anti-sigma-K factor RskA